MLKRRSVDRKGSKSERCSRPKRKKPPQRPDKMECETTYTSSAAKKLSGRLHEVSWDPNFSYCILQFTAVFAAISECAVCRTCGGDIKFLKASARGLGFKLNVFCTKCDDNIQSVFSSPLINTAYEINRRFTFAFRLLGKGLKAMQLFCGVMDLASCIAQTSFDSIMKNIEEASTVVAKASMKAAAEEEVQECASQDKLQLSQNGIIVSGDGTWMKRGFSSLYGVTTLIGYFTGKVIDFVVKSKYCKECEIHLKQKGTAEYESWLENHQEDCAANHTGSSGIMEPNSVVEMFQRSLENYGIKYEYYIGDGDTKTFSSIRKAQPYEDLEVKKKECVGHVQKRMGKRLRQVISDSKKSTSSIKETESTTEKNNKKITSNESKRVSLGGRGKLTAKLIDELTIYYGLAIRNNIDSLENMKNAIWATFYHKSSTDEKPQHTYCPPGEESWCDWQRAKARGTLDTYNHKAALPEVVLQAIKPIYESLSDDQLLEKCLGGFTQNVNESLNSKIWKIAPKCCPGSKRIVDIASNIAVCTFNDGAEALLRIGRLLGITTGYEGYHYCLGENANRLKHARINATKATKEARTIRRLEKNKQQQFFTDKEGVQYEAGMGD